MAMLASVISRGFWLSFFVFTFLCAEAFAQSQLPQALEGVGILDRRGAQLPLDQIKLQNESGQTVTLGQYFDGTRPVVLSLVYFECPSICTFILNGLVQGLRKLKWTPGEEFEVLSVSIDPKEGAELASEKKKAYLEALGRHEAEKGWHFLTGTEENIKKIAETVGFGYRWVEEEEQFAHGSGIFILTPEGRLSRTLYGIQYDPKDLRLALLEGSENKIGSVIDQLIMFCYRFDPNSRGYALHAFRLMQAGGATTVFFMGSVAFVFWRRQRRKDKKGARER